MVFRHRAGNRPQAHAFDYHPADEWTRVLKALPQKDIHLKITGGEPFLDRRNMLAVLQDLTADHRFHIRVDTNGTWDPRCFSGIRKNQIYLNVSYHPRGAGSIESFLHRIKAIREEGFQVTEVNYVLAPENLEGGEQAIARIEREGFFVNVGAMMALGAYASRENREPEEVRVLRRYNTPLDLKYRLQNPVTRGRKCFHPALSYYALYDGSIQVYCMPHTRRDWFQDGPPDLPRSAVSCPAEHCDGCLEMYRALPDEPLLTEDLGMCELPDYVCEVKKHRRAYRAKAMLRSVPVLGHLFPSEEPTQSRPPIVRNNARKCTTAAGQIRGSIDSCFGPDFGPRVRSGDRLALAGSVETHHTGDPVHQILVFFESMHVTTIEHFQHTAGSGRYGWKTMLYVPQVTPGVSTVRLVALTESGIECCFATREVEVVG